MSRFTRRAITVTVAAGSLALLAIAPSTSAAAAPSTIPSNRIIVIPGPDQVSNTLDASRCPWLKAYIAALTGGIGSAQSADRNPVAPGTASGFASAGMG